MFAAIKNFFIQRKKEKLRNNHGNHQPTTTIPRKSRVVYSAATEEPLLHVVTPVPYWYDENGSFEDVHFLYPNKDLVAPVINEEMRETLKNYVQDVSPEPDGSMALYSKLNDPNASVKEISALVSSDPILAAHILKLVNSAAFGLTMEVTSVGRAVTLLGFSNVRAAVLQHSIKQGISGIEGDYAAIIREHSMMASAIALHIGDSIKSVDNFTLSSIALLHDIGKVLYPSMKSKGKGLKLSAEIPEQVVEALIASVFAELWELPEKIWKTLEFIHHPYFYDFNSVPEDVRPTATALAMANQLATIMGFRDGEESYEIALPYLNEIYMIDEPENWIDDNIATKIESTRGALK